MVSIVLYNAPARRRGRLFSRASMTNLMEYATDERNNILKTEYPHTIGRSGGGSYIRMDFIENGVVVCQSFRRRGPRKGYRSFFGIRGPKERAEQVRDALLEVIGGRKYC